MNLVNKRCVGDLADSESCRDSQTQDAKDKLKFIDKCIGDQATDPNNGRLAPDVEPPCDVCIDGGGVIDRKCMKSCFEQAVAELSDGIIGDIAERGNGIEQPGEFCDDGNLDDGDCCSSTCTVEPPGTEGPMGDATCTDGIDNDCDSVIDAADPNCQ